MVGLLDEEVLLTVVDACALEVITVNEIVLKDDTKSVLVTTVMKELVVMDEGVYVAETEVKSEPVEY